MMGKNPRNKKHCTRYLLTRNIVGCRKRAVLGHGENCRDIVDVKESVAIVTTAGSGNERFRG